MRVGSTRAVSTLLAVAIVVAVPACKRKRKDGFPKRSADRGPSQTYEGYRLAVSPPPGWKILEAARAKFLEPDAIAVLEGKPGRLYATARWVAATDLAEIARHLHVAESTAILTNEPTRFLKRPAHLVRGTRTVDGSVRHFVWRGLLIQGYLYEFELETSGLRPRDEGFDAFELLKGEIVPPKPAIPRDQIGSTWLAQSGRLQTLLGGGLEVVAPSRWRLVLGAEHDSEEDEDGFFLEGPDVLLFVSGQATAGQDRSDVMATHQSTTVGKATIERKETYTLLGAPIELVLYEQYGVHSFSGVQATDRGIVMVYGERPSGARIEASELSTALASISLLDDASLASLRSELEKTTHPTLFQDQESTCRGGRYANFTHGVTLHLPGRLWHIQCQGTDTDLFTAESVDERVEFELSVETANIGDPESDHDIAATVDFGSAKPVPTKMHGWLVSMGRPEDKARAPHLALATRNVRGVLFELQISTSSPAVSKRHLEAFLENTTFDGPREPVSISPRRLIDHRFGFEFSRGTDGLKNRTLEEWSESFEWENEELFVGENRQYVGDEEVLFRFIEDEYRKRLVRDSKCL